MKCYKCEITLTNENKSKEHVIPNACGGRLVSSELLCKTCNSTFGNKYDNALATTTNHLVNMLHVKRHRGEAQPIKATRNETGETYYLELGGHPINPIPEITEENHNGRIKINIKAPNQKSLNKAIEGIIKKYPHLSKNDFTKNTDAKEFYIDDSFKISSHIGDNDEFKSICKTAINFYILKGGKRKYISHLLDSIVNDDIVENVWMYYPEKHVYEYKEDEITHVIKIKGDPLNRILYGYVELFNYQCFIVKLSDSYDGDEIDVDYIFNVHTYDVKNNLTNLSLSRDDLLNNRSFCPQTQIQKRHSHIIRISDRLTRDFHIKNMISKAVDNTMKRYPDKSELTVKMQEESKEEFFRHYLGYLSHLQMVTGE